MRTLIDGYNVMFAAGLMGRTFKPEQFRRARARFLNDLAATLDAVEAHQTTVIFDAVDSPDHLPSRSRHKGISVEFAVDADSADERIEGLIADHSSPRTLTVVSSDLRIQRAASRRKAKVVSADDFLSEIEDRRGRKRTTSRVEIEIPERPEVPSAEESEFWMAEFREVVDSPEAREIFRGDPAFPTDEELARIAREVEEEFRRP